MADPRDDIMGAVNWGAASRLDLIERQEFSRTAGGQVIGKSFGTALWRATMVTNAMYRDQIMAFEAMLRSLDGVVRGLYLGDPRRIFPLSRPDGDFSDAGAFVQGLGGDGRSLRIGGLGGGFQLASGDYFCVIRPSGLRELYQAMESVAADGGGLTPLFEVRPHLRPGIAVNDSVALKGPTTLFVLEPGSVQTSMQDVLIGSVSFTAMESP